MNSISDFREFSTHFLVVWGLSTIWTLTNFNLNLSLIPGTRWVIEFLYYSHFVYLTLSLFPGWTQQSSLTNLIFEISRQSGGPKCIKRLISFYQKFHPKRFSSANNPALLWQLQAAYYFLSYSTCLVFQVFSLSKNIKRLNFLIWFSIQDIFSDKQACCSLTISETIKTTLFFF